MRARDFHSYAGSVQDIIHDGQPALKFHLDGADNSRHVSIEQFIPPVRVAGWLRPSFHSQSTTPYDGLHIHVGHIGNERNYATSIVRRDGNQKIAVEYGWKEYTTLDTAPSKGVQLKWDRTYMFEVVWERNRITSWVGNEVEHSTMTAEIPDKFLIPSGSIGLRLDEMECIGMMDIRQI